MIADIHNHNHSRAYFWLKAKEKQYRKQDMFNPWTIVASNMRSLEKAGMASGYGQADLVKLLNGKVSLTFNALYPIEKGFFDSEAFKGDHSGTVKERLIRFLTSKELPIRDFLQMYVMRIPDRIIDYIQSSDYTYWQALNDEYQFAIIREGLKSRSKILIPGLRRIFENAERRRSKYPQLLDASGIFRIPKNLIALKESLSNDAEITMVLTIEGGHSLGTDQGTIIDWLKNIEFIKKEWKHPIFFMTLAHHFNNQLCGHAHSFPDVGSLILNQKTNLNGKFNNDGWKVIRKLLALTEDNEKDPSEAYRILIDVKHMSACSRKEYYEQIIRPCQDKGINIPVIASHCGHSGRKTLDELISNYNQEKDDSFDPTDVLNNWNINVCDEDINMIYETAGLLGLSLDQRIMGVPKEQKKTGGRNTIIAFWLNLKATLDAVYKRTDLTSEEKFIIWNRITLGSDFEGFIDPINEFKTALEYRGLKTKLIQHIENERLNTSQAFYGLQSFGDVEKVVERLFVENAKAFVIEHYPIQ
ncbi:hypothetical protein LVD15_21810 [Fulvivirga maritima]|uniref:hypothetical protein n=1 Tax=Fulvivirga maritima TaxID=2904247 RepID=UPI001F260171|nr:hypothetical protein [Fulvivirga maritima]UII25909.1 hypothetical protein LVD15_21810 [Fulvivirga maritima]